MTANNHVTYNEAEKRYEMPFGHLVVYANVRRKRTPCIPITFSRRRNCAAKVRPGSSCVRLRRQLAQAA
jgi:hypothetical protein